MSTGSAPRPPRAALLRVLVLGAACAGLAAQGCALTPAAPWRAGVQVAGDPRAPRPFPRRQEDVAVFFKEEFGAFEPTEERRTWMCGSTTVLRKAFLLPAPTETRLERARWARDRRALLGAEVAGWITTEEFPRDEKASRILGDEVSTIFGIGRTWEELFEVRLDPAWREDALRRLRELAVALGADAVIDVYATGEAEHHMWLGTSLGFDSTQPDSPVYCHAQLLDLRLRDVRLHGTAVRYED